MVNLKKKEHKVGYGHTIYEEHVFNRKKRNLETQSQKWPGEFR